MTTASEDREMHQGRDNAASVAICTYNRCQSLQATLETLRAQKGVAWNGIEIIIVDNNCDDDTASVVEAFAHELPIRRIVERNQGLSYARNRAIKEARGDWIIFTDDDVRLDDRWLGNYLRAFAAYPQAGLAGGRILPDWRSAPPRWFKGERLDMLDGVLVWYDLGGENRVMQARDPHPFGASMAVRRSLVLEDAFRLDLGVRGPSRGRGEDTELMARLRNRGVEGLYVGSALCWHQVDPHRLSLQGLYQYGVESGRSYKKVFEPQHRGSAIKALDFLARGLFQLVKGRGDRFRQCVIHVGFELGSMRS